MSAGISDFRRRLTWGNNVFNVRNNNSIHNIECALTPKYFNVCNK